MNRIHLLPPHIVAKIAAGEVIENPASIVKELLDNSIDAQATDIRIDLLDAGKERLTVRDNGEGMSYSDVLVSYLPHTTSKLTDDDLLHIHQLGFRGEALSSIGAVAKLTIKSRPVSSDVGTVLHVENGEQVSISNLGMPEGTEIIVENLFAHVPARKSFLRDGATELRSIVALVNQYALAYPHIGFSLTNEHKHILDLRAQETSERIRSIMGQEIHAQLMPVHHETEFGTLSGFIGTPQLATPHASHQHFFLNNRVIDSRAIATGIVHAYGTLLEKLTHPPFVLWLSLPHTHVDVNVHPRKDTVRFLYPDNIAELVNGAVKKTLRAHDLAYKDRAETALRDASGNALLQDRHMDTHLADMLKDALKLREQKISPAPIIQVHNTYLITETADGVLLVDQHAAHERVLFEKFLHTFEHVQAEKKIHALEKPTLIELSDEEAVHLESQQEVFAQLGFDIENFGPRTFKVSSVPEIYHNRDLRKLIPEVLHDLIHHKETSPLDHETKRTLSFLACRSAIKAGDPLTEADTRTLITELAQCTIPYTCPHGRPTHIELSRRELDKMFKRTQ